LASGLEDWCGPGQLELPALPEGHCWWPRVSAVGVFREPIRERYTTTRVCRPLPGAGRCSLTSASGTYWDSLSDLHGMVQFRNVRINPIRFICQILEILSRALAHTSCVRRSHDTDGHRLSVSNAIDSDASANEFISPCVGSVAAHMVANHELTHL
jgi:hypothetical protein